MAGSTSEGVTKGGSVSIFLRTLDLNEQKAYIAFKVGLPCEMDLVWVFHALGTKMRRPYEYDDPTTNLGDWL